jgi:ABC-2 type transport system permease protein
VEHNEKQIDMRQFFTFVSKEFRHVFRDRKTMLMLFGLPIAQILLFGFALTNEIKDSKIAILDLAKDPASRAIIEKIAASDQFEIASSLQSQAGIEETFKKGSANLVLVFPVNFNEDLLGQNSAQIQVIADASDPNEANTLTNYINFIVGSYQREELVTEAMPLQINTEIRMLYNPELKGATNFVPGVMALVLMLVCTLMTSVSIVREKENGTMEILLVSPMNPFLVIVSKAIPYFILSLVNLTVILLLSIFLLDMPFNGSYFLFYFESSLLIIAALSLGLLISTSTNSQQAAMLISLMGMLVPTMLLTGFMFPLENMPVPLQVISNIIPSRWYYIIAKSIMIKGLGFAAIWKETLILLSMTVFFLTISFKKFNIRLQ